MDDDQDDQDDEHWLGRSLYFNRADRRVLVPKRLGFGVGRTLNLGHPMAWLIVVVVVGVVLLTALARSR